MAASLNGTGQTFCFIPSEEIDVVVLAAYLQCFVDNTATVKLSRHPDDSTRSGFIVGASEALSRGAANDIVNDTREWEKEQATRAFHSQPYDYSESDTWAARKRQGPITDANQKSQGMPSRTLQESRHGGAYSQAARIQAPQPSQSENRHRTPPLTDPRMKASEFEPSRDSQTYNRNLPYIPVRTTSGSFPSRSTAPPQSIAVVGRHSPQVAPRSTRADPAAAFRPADLRSARSGSLRVTSEPSDEDLRKKWWHKRADSAKVILRKQAEDRSSDDRLLGAEILIFIDNGAPSSFISDWVFNTLDAEIEDSCEKEYEDAVGRHYEVLGLVRLELSWVVRNGKQITNSVTFTVIKGLNFNIVMSPERARELGLNQIAQPVDKGKVAKTLAPIKEKYPPVQLPKRNAQGKAADATTQQQVGADNRRRDDPWDARRRDKRHPPNQIGQ